MNTIAGQTRGMVRAVVLAIVLGAIALTSAYMTTLPWNETNTNNMLFVAAAVFTVWFLLTIAAICIRFGRSKS